MEQGLQSRKDGIEIPTPRKELNGIEGGGYFSKELSEDGLDSFSSLLSFFLLSFF